LDKQTCFPVIKSYEPHLTLHYRLAFPRYYSGEDEANPDPCLQIERSIGIGMEPFIGSKKGAPTHYWWSSFSLSAYQPSLKQIALAVAVHRLTSLRRVIFPLSVRSTKAK
jgi:hypothetical protein